MTLMENRVMLGLGAQRTKLWFKKKKMLREHFPTELDNGNFA